jgi:hypothetical protein
MLRGLLRLIRGGSPGWARPIPVSGPNRAAQVQRLLTEYGIRLVERDPKGNARPLTADEMALLRDTLHALGPAWYGPFRDSPINFWIDRNPGGGSYGNGWLRIGDPGKDLSILYRILIHEGTHASNEYRGWIYEHDWCFRPGLDWVKKGDAWTHPRQQGVPPQPGDWETLPVDARDVSVAPGEDLAEMVRYFVHSVKGERQFLWPLDRSRPALYLWDTSPTRYVFVRDVFLRLPPDHPWYRRLSAGLEARAAANLGLQR